MPDHLPKPPDPALAVVGIGAEGWAGLTGRAREVLGAAQVIFGSRRQLDLLPLSEVNAEQVCWPTPLVPALEGLLEADRGRRRVVLASGDPTFHGIATTIARVLPGLPLDILPVPSSVSLACARLGWAQQDVEVISLIGRPPATLHPSIQPGRRLLVLVPDVEAPAQVAALLRGRDFGASRLVALSDLGAKDEQRIEAPAGHWADDVQLGRLVVLAVECVAAPGTARRSTTPGLPDDAYENDGQLTKRHVRAITLSSLAPSPGELLWDVGGGAGSIGIEWMRQHRSCRAISIERDAGRVARIERNAAALGVPGLQVVTGSAPECLAGLPTPDAIFVGGGAGTPGLIDACWRALPPGGRIVVNVTTLESERAVGAALAAHGGELVRIQVTMAGPVGRYTGWRPAMPVTQWTATVPADPVNPVDSGVSGVSGVSGEAGSA